VLGRFRTEDPIRDRLNWYIYCSSNPISYIDPSGLVDVALREHLNKAYGIDNKDIVWDPKTRGATVTFRGVTHTFYGNINSDGIMRIDDNIILRIFGLPIFDIASRSLLGDFLETIPIVDYAQAAFGINLNGQQLTTAQREAKLSQGLNASADALCNGLIMGGTIEFVGPMPAISSTGRTVANNLNEQLAMKQVLSNPLQGARRVDIEMNDTRWLKDNGWVKMENVIRTPEKNITVHFNYNTKTGEFADFKFK